MAELWERLGSGGALPRLDQLAALRCDGWTVGTGAVLFPRPEATAAA
jgi:hypothetical protein